MSYTYGADPEMAVFDTNLNMFISAHDLLPGTKSQPFPVEYGAVQVDGLFAEFNIDPAKTFSEFQRNIKAVRQQMLEIIQRNNPNAILVASPTAKFDQEYFDNLPASTKVLGCDPDYTGDTGKVNPRPDPGNRPFRTGGGHVHIGWTDGKDPLEAGHFNDCAKMAVALYNSGLKTDYLWDGDKERRELYGSKFSFRPKSFGMEYRYLSNAWVDNDNAMKFVFDVVQNTIRGLDQHFEKSYKSADGLPFKNAVYYDKALLEKVNKRRRVHFHSEFAVANIF